MSTLPNLVLLSEPGGQTRSKLQFRHHAAGIVWGDVKAQNVLIDGDDNAWIIDFGGGYTGGWVDKKVAGTVQGDVAGLAKLKEFIFQDED